MKKIVLVATVMFLFVGCNKFLEIKPKGYTIPEYYQDYVKLMNGFALNDVTFGYPVILTDDITFGRGDEFFNASLGGQSEGYQNMFTFAHGPIFPAGSSDQFWVVAYRNMFTYNVVINDVGEVKDATDDQKNKLKAEALMGRAFLHFMLVNGYGKHYDKVTADKDYGVPIILKGDINTTYRRNSVAEVYAQVLKDIKEALPYLGDVGKNKYQPTKQAAYAFLARVYLYMGAYDEALTNAKEVLRISKHLNDYKAYYIDYGFVYNGENQSVGGYAIKNEQNIYVRKSSSLMPFRFFVSEDLMRLFEKDMPEGAIDQRERMFFLRDGFPDWGIEFPGRVTYHIDAQSGPNEGFSTPETLLIAAECEARVGDKDIAMQYINELRGMRIIGNTTLMAKDKTQALQYVLEERRRELAYNSYCMRLFDIKRLKLNVEHEVNGVKWSVNGDDNRLIISIPLDVIDKNPTMPQYER